MQVDAQVYLKLIEQAIEGGMAFVDIESANLNADFGTIVTVSVKPYGHLPITLTAKPGNDKRLLKDLVKLMDKFNLWVTFYGKLFDIPFINSRLMMHGMAPLPKKHHLDLYWTVKSNTHISRRNQGHLLNWLRVPEEKMSVSPNVWAELAANYDENIQTLIKRCESDVVGLEALYEKVKLFVREISR